MNTIKVFLAASEELDYYRLSFGNLVRRLDDMYERRGIRIRLYDWEDYDVSYNSRIQQEEYNAFARKSDMFIALFGKEAKRFTLEGFDAALAGYHEIESPKVYVYCKDMAARDRSASLVSFQNRLKDEMGYYWCRYDNRESLQFHFVMQLHLQDAIRNDELKVEGGVVSLSGLPVAPMDKLLFVSANEDYQSMSNELSILPEKIEMARLRLRDNPEDEQLREDLQHKLDRYNDLKDEFSAHQMRLFMTAKRAAQLQGARISARIRHALEALEEGNVRYANRILDMAEEDAQRNLDEFKQSRSVTSHMLQNGYFSIEELLLKASSIMADASISIEKRKSIADNAYSLADEIAQECNYDKEKHINLLFDYGEFLGNYAFYAKAEVVAKRLVQLCEETYDKEHPKVAASFTYMGHVYERYGNYLKSLEYHLKALSIREKSFGLEHPATANSCLNVAGIYHYLGEYDRAISYYQRTISIQEKVLGLEHPVIAGSYNNIGCAYKLLGNYDKALDYFKKALTIQEKEYGIEHYDTAIMYSNIGDIDYYKGNYALAIENFQRVLAIQRKIRGEEHPSTADALNNLGVVFLDQGDYRKSLNYYQKSLAIREKVLGFDHPDTADSYNNIGRVYGVLGDYNKELEYYKKTLVIFEKVFGLEHPDTATVYNNIGIVYSNKRDYRVAYNYHQKALAIREKVLGLNHPDTADSYNSFGVIYYDIGDYGKALEYYYKALAIREKVLGLEHPATININTNIGKVYLKLGDKVRAKEYLERANK